jgi:hypothetical protein
MYKLLGFALVKYGIGTVPTMYFLRYLSISELLNYYKEDLSLILIAVDQRRIPPAGVMNTQLSRMTVPLAFPVLRIGDVSPGSRFFSSRDPTTTNKRRGKNSCLAFSA